MNHPDRSQERDHLAVEKIFEYLDGELAPDDLLEVEGHLRQCPECQSRAAEIRSFFETIESQPEISLERDLKLDVLQALSNAEQPGWFYRIGVAIQFVLALSLLILVIPFLLQSPTYGVIQTRYTEILQEIFIELQSIWDPLMKMFGDLRQFSIEIPALPALPFSLYALLLAIAGASLMWFIGNVILLRSELRDQNQSKKIWS